MKKTFQFILYSIILVGFLLFKFADFDNGISTDRRLDNSFLKESKKYKFDVTFINGLDSLSMFNTDKDFLFLHQIEGFKDIDIDSIKVEKIDYLDKIEFPTFINNNWGYGIDIKSQTTALSSKNNLILMIPEDYKSETSIEGNSLSFTSSGFAILNHNNIPLIKYSFPEKRNLNIIFNKQDNIMRLAVLVNKTDNEIINGKELEQIKSKHQYKKNQRSVYKDTFNVKSKSIIFFKPSEKEFYEYVEKDGAESGIYEIDSDFIICTNNLKDKYKNTEVHVEVAYERLFRVRNYINNRDTIIDKFKNGKSHYGVIINKKNKKPFVYYGVMTDVDIISIYNE